MSLGWGCENGTLEGYTRALRTRGGLGGGSTRDVLPGEGGLGRGGVGGLAESMGALEGPRAGEGPGLGKKARLDGRALAALLGLPVYVETLFLVAIYLFSKLLTQGRFVVSHAHRRR